MLRLKDQGYVGDELELFAKAQKWKRDPLNLIEPGP